MSSLRSQRLFLRRVGEALSPYQALEAILKLYIQAAHLRIQWLLSANGVPFHYQDSEYENAPLEQLIRVFQRHTNNKKLVQRLNKAKKTRNYIAHKVIGDYMLDHETKPTAARAISRKLKKLTNEGNEVFEELQKEVKTLLGEVKSLGQTLLRR